MTTKAFSEKNTQYQTTLVLNSPLRGNDRERSFLEIPQATGLVQQSTEVFFPEISHQHRADRRNQGHENHNDALANG